MEALLRLWGAEQAAQQQDLPPAPPVLKPVRLDLRYALLCAGCVAAGAIVAIGAMLLARRNQKSSAPAGPAITMPSSAAPAAKTAKDRRAAPERTFVTPESGKTISDFRTMKTRLAEMRIQRDGALALAAESDRQRKRLLEEKQNLRKQLDRSQRVNEAVEQLDRKIHALRKEQEAALTTANNLRKKLAVHGEKHRAKYRRMRDVYLTAVAPSRHGMEAAQTAARKSRLLQRCAALQTEMQNEAMRNLLDRIEAVLLRMDFLNADDVTGVFRFEDQLRQSDLLPTITASVPRASDNRNLQLFLAEVDLILSGVQRVG